jgi:hypothetical protein
MGRGENILALFEAQYRQEIPDHAYRRAASSGIMYWVRCVYNIQQKARELGLVDSPARGLWRLTEDGHKWLLDHPDATHFTEQRPHTKNRGVASSSRVKKDHQYPSEKEKLTADNSKSKILTREIANIQAYLDGHSSLQPSYEKLCDWVYFCYTFEMYPEGRDLFALISPNEVNPWYYERTKKLARLCELKA